MASNTRKFPTSPRRIIDMWYVVLTKVRQEQRAAENLRNQGGEVYLPMLSVERIRRGKRCQQEEALFPGYLFLKASPQDALLGKVRSTFGVRGLLRFGEEPVTVADALIQDIRQRSRQKPKQQYASGQSVLLTSGPFKDYQAIFHSYNGTERAIILIHLLGQQNQLLIDLAQLQT